MESVKPGVRVPYRGRQAIQILRYIVSFPVGRVKFQLCILPFSAPGNPPNFTAAARRRTKNRTASGTRRLYGELVKNLVEFAPAGDAPHVVPPRGIAASACAKKVPPALFLNAAALDKTRYARQVWNLCASSAQIMRAAGCGLFKRDPRPRFAFERASGTRRPYGELVKIARLTFVKNCVRLWRKAAPPSECAARWSRTAGSRPRP